jgi:two-component system, OmpR family, KDP operon response regulator KdpE
MLQRVSPRWSADPGSASIQPLVLVVEDDRDTWLPLQSMLASQGFRVIYARTGAHVLSSAIEHQPDLVILDASSLVGDLADLVGRLRVRTSAPIVAVVAEDADRERAFVLDAGVDDYVAKPFVARDLVTRMRVWMARGARAAIRATETPSATLGLRLDARRRTLYVDGRQVHVTPIECRIVAALVRKSRGGLTEDELAAAVWGKAAHAHRSYLRNHLRQLRQKIERDPDRPHYMLTGSGGRHRLKVR